CLAATVEQRSEHPLAKPLIAEVTRRGILPLDVPLQEFHSHTGLGVHARVQGTWIGIGREGLFSSHDFALPPELLEEAARDRAQGQTALLMLAPEEGLYG